MRTAPENAIFMQNVAMSATPFVVCFFGGGVCVCMGESTSVFIQRFVKCRVCQGAMSFPSPLTKM